MPRREHQGDCWELEQGADITGILSKNGSFWTTGLVTFPAFMLDLNEEFKNNRPFWLKSEYVV